MISRRIQVACASRRNKIEDVGFSSAIKDSEIVRHRLPELLPCPPVDKAECRELDEKGILFVKKNGNVQAAERVIRVSAEYSQVIWANPNQIGPLATLCSPRP
jgi:hypothetical protein